MAGTRSAKGAVRFSIVSTNQLLLEDAVNTSDLQVETSLGQTLANGTGANQFNRTWQMVARDLANAATENLDVYDFAAFDIGAGAGLDSLGQSMALAEVVGILIINNGPGKLEVDTSVANGWTNFLASGAQPVLNAGGQISRYEPTDPAMAVADGSNHLIKFTASVDDLTYDVHILGRSS